MHLTPFLKRWILFVCIITVFCGMTEWAVQQNYRMNANDPQIQMAEDAATKLAGGAQPSSLVGTEKIDIAKSLAPFLVIYDGSAKVLATSGMLNNEAPQIPSGIFGYLTYPTKHTEDRVSWQPQAGVRIALIVRNVPGTKQYFVAAGRSLREVEKRESMLMSGMTLGWFVLVVGIGLLLWYFEKMKKPVQPQQPNIR